MWRHHALHLLTQQHHSSDRKNQIRKCCFNNCQDTEFITTHVINWSAGLTVTSVYSTAIYACLFIRLSVSLSDCLSICLSLSLPVCLLHCRIQQQDGSLLSKEKQRNAPVSVLVLPLGCTIWQSEAGAGRESEKCHAGSSTAGSEAVKKNKSCVFDFML